MSSRNGAAQRDRDQKKENETSSNMSEADLVSACTDIPPSSSSISLVGCLCVCVDMCVSFPVFRILSCADLMFAF